MQENMLEVFRLQMEKFHQTQNIQWKINISFWAAIGLSAYFLCQFGVTIQFHYPLWLFWVMGALYVLWSILIQRSISSTRSIAYMIREQIIRGEDYDEASRTASIRKFKKTGWSDILWLTVQSLFSALLLIMLYQINRLV